MKYISTKGGSPAIGFTQAITDGLAPDGGLYVPESFPQFDPRALADAASLSEAFAAFLAPFVGDDPLADQLTEICEGAFDFPLTLSELNDTTKGLDTRVLELFHGPTAAFKDFGARFLAECFQRRAQVSTDRPLTVLVATSGDTGGAVAAAFHKKPGIRVGVLFPKGGVSPAPQGGAPQKP